MFDYLPLAAVVKQDIFCVHGGLSPSIETISEISKIDRFKEIPHEGAFTDLMWSDPSDDNKGFTVSSRGAGYLFGIQIVEKFLHINK